tara:strand:+ start:323 stop:1186 length:864 start_codon:yes stop_codon:yes gene_type:complete
MQAERLCTGYGLIEGPVWDDDRGLLFSDVVHGGVFCLKKDGDISTIFEHRRGIGGMCLHRDGGMIVSGRNIAFKSFAGGDSVTVLDNNPEKNCVGFNDLVADSRGRIYAGSLGSSPVFDDGLPPTAGQLFLIELDGSAHAIADDVRLTNGLGFSPDGKTLYHSDSRQETVFKYAVNDDGTVGPKQTFCKTERGVPDGLVVDETGQVLVALAAGGHGVAVYAPDATEAGFIEIDLPMCTSVCFGDADLKALFIVSGSDGAGSDRAGSIYRTSWPHAGLPVGVAAVPTG